VVLNEALVSVERRAVRPVVAGVLLMEVFLCVRPLAGCREQCREQR
jgi:hypothetical protein